MHEDPTLAFALPLWKLSLPSTALPRQPVGAHGTHIEILRPAQQPASDHQCGNSEPDHHHAKQHHSGFSCRATGPRAYLIPLIVLYPRMATRTANEFRFRRSAIHNPFGPYEFNLPTTGALSRIHGCLLITLCCCCRLRATDRTDRNSGDAQAKPLQLGPGILPSAPESLPIPSARLQVDRSTLVRVPALAVSTRPSRRQIANFMPNVDGIHALSLAPGGCDCPVNISNKSEARL